MRHIYRVFLFGWFIFILLGFSLEAVLAAPPLPTDYGDYSQAQTFLFSAIKGHKSGIDAEYAWTIAGGKGANVTIFDIEHAWNIAHVELIDKFLEGGIAFALPGIPVEEFCGPQVLFNHGTSVLGILTAAHDVDIFGFGRGVKGIVPEAKILLSPAEEVAGSLSVASALAQTIALLNHSFHWPVPAELRRSKPECLQKGGEAVFDLGKGFIQHKLLA